MLDVYKRAQLFTLHLPAGAAHRRGTNPHVSTAQGLAGSLSVRSKTAHTSSMSSPGTPYQPLSDICSTAHSSLLDGSRKGRPGDCEDIALLSDVLNAPAAEILRAGGLHDEELPGASSAAAHSASCLSLGARVIYASCATFLEALAGRELVSAALPPRRQAARSRR